jgi:3-oxoacyl-(acyl-carrier-protein) synthase
MLVSFSNRSEPFYVSGTGRLFPEAETGDVEYSSAEQLDEFKNWKKFRSLSPDEKMMMIVCKRALNRGDLSIRDTDGTRVGIVFTTRFGTFTNYEEFEESIREENLRPSVFTHAISNAPASAASIYWGIQGPTMTLPAGEQTQPEALAHANDLIIEDRCDLVLVGGWGYRSETYRRDTSDGKEGSEGAVALLLESEEFLEERGHDSYTSLRWDETNPDADLPRFEKTREGLDLGDENGGPDPFLESKRIPDAPPISLLANLSVGIDYSRRVQADGFRFNYSLKDASQSIKLVGRNANT